MSLFLKAIYEGFQFHFQTSVRLLTSKFVVCYPFEVGENRSSGNLNIFTMTNEYISVKHDKSV